MGRICGIDEAGRGPVIGPMVMAGVVISEEKISQLEELGIKDSKQHSPKERNELFDKVKDIVDDYSIKVVSAEQIDKALTSENSNLNWLEADTSVKIITRLSPDKAILDCPSTNVNSYREYLEKKLNLDVELVVEHKADERYIVSSAASILAKVSRDREIEKLKEEYGDFGSGYPSDPKTKAFIEKNHKLPIFRKTWNTWKNVDSAKKQSKLFDF